MIRLLGLVVFLGSHTGEQVAEKVRDVRRPRPLLSPSSTTKL